MKIIVTAVVSEERSGAKEILFAVNKNQLNVDYAICGEASDFEIRDARKSQIRNCCRNIVKSCSLKCTVKWD
jgi:hypothetical protein